MLLNDGTKIEKQSSKPCVSYSQIPLREKIRLFLTRQNLSDSCCLSINHASLTQNFQKISVFN